AARLVLANEGGEPLFEDARSVVRTEVASDAHVDDRRLAERGGAVEDEPRRVEHVRIEEAAFARARGGDDQRRAGRNADVERRVEDALVAAAHFHALHMRRTVVLDLAFLRTIRAPVDGRAAPFAARARPRAFAGDLARLPGQHEPTVASGDGGHVRPMAV